MRIHRSLLLTTFALLSCSGLYIACGGDDSTGAPAEDAGSDATVDGGADTSTPDTSTGDTSTDTSTADTSTQDATDNDAAGDAGDAGADALADVQLQQDTGSTVNDAGPGGDGAVLSCGAASCALPAETCCVYPTNSQFYVACSTGASCPLLTDAGFDAGTPVALQCESQANCQGGLVCCMTATNDGGTISAHCANACSGGDQHAILCDPTAADAGCAVDAGCSTSNIGSWDLPKGFATCGGVLR